MCEMKLMDLQLFGEGGDGGAAGDAGQGEGSAAEINIGDVLADGTVVDESLASSMREYPELYATLSREQQAHAQAPGKGQAEAVQEQAGNEAEPTREEWEEAKKKFKKFFGEDVHASVNDRFKNQADATKQLERQQKVLDAMMKQAGVSSFEELEDAVNSDALEAEAAEKDIPVDVLRQMKELEAANAQHAEAERRAKDHEHVMGLIQQGKELQKIYPDFDVIKELNENPRFVELTSPGVGLSVQEAFQALHGQDMQAQILAMGVQAGKEQTARAVRANGMRPVEGAIRGGRSGAGTGAAPVTGSFTDEQYEAIKAKMLREGPQTL